MNGMEWNTEAIENCIARQMFIFRRAEEKKGKGLDILFLFLLPKVQCDSQQLRLLEY